MGKSITRIWGFRLHFRESQTSMAEYIDFTLKKKKNNRMRVCFSAIERSNLSTLFKSCHKQRCNQARASDGDTSEQKNHSEKSALFVARDVLPSTDSTITPLLCRDATTQEGLGNFLEEASTLVSLSDLKHQHTNTMAFQSSPNKRTKVMEPA